MSVFMASSLWISNPWCHNCGMKDKTVRITARISELAYSLLTGEAERLMRNDRSRIPYGKLLDAILMDLADSWDDEDWEEVRDSVLEEWEERKKLRMEKDRDRKRAKGKTDR